MPTSNNSWTNNSLQRSKSQDLRITKKKSLLLKSSFLLLSILGFFDSVYLTIAHYKDLTVPCQIAHGCEKVLTSSYAELFGIPIALFGALFYLSLIIGGGLYYQRRSIYLARYLKIAVTWGFLYSMYLIYLQAFVIHAFCQYCLLSEVIATCLFIVSLLFSKYGKSILDL